jgi:hypothetical protein
MEFPAVKLSDSSSLHSQIADLSQLKEALGTTVDVTISRRLRQLNHRYSNSGRF